MPARRRVQASSGKQGKHREQRRDQSAVHAPLHQQPISFVHPSLICEGVDDHNEPGRLRIRRRSAVDVDGSPAVDFGSAEVASAMADQAAQPLCSGEPLG